MSALEALPGVPAAEDALAASGLAARVAAVEDRVRTLAETAPPAGSQGQAPAASPPEREALEARLTDRIAVAETRLAVLEQAAGDRTPGRGVLVVAVGQLRDRMGTAAPFADELVVVQALVDGWSDPAVAEALDAVETIAPDGAPTAGSLAQRFAAVADTVAAAPVSVDTGWAAELWSRLRGVVQVRRTGDVAGDDPTARVARAEVRLAEGDLAAAVAEIAALDGPPADVAAGWLTDARARLAVERASIALAEFAAAAVLAEGS